MSSETLAEFRELSLLALWFSFFYFIGVTIGNINYFSTQDFSKVGIFFSPNILFIAVGVVGVLLPFYNIHIVLLKMKKAELKRIEQESKKLAQQIDDTITQRENNQQVDYQIEKIYYRLFGLQIQEKYVKEAKE